MEEAKKVMNSESSLKNEQKLDINIDTILLLWSKTYNTAGKPDRYHIFPYYHNELVYQDTI